MSEVDFTLRFELEASRSPDADHVADALKAWVEIVRTAGSVIDPDSEIRVELVAVQPGSQKFLLALKKAEEFADNVTKGASDYPLLSKAAMALGALVGGTLISNAVTPDPRIPEDQMDVFVGLQNELRESNELERQSQRFYGILQEEPAIAGIEVLRGPEQTPFYRVPRREFSERSGMWGPEAQVVYEPRSRTARWKVTLIKAVFVPKPRRWTFSRDGLEFSATMEDPRVLEAIRNRNLPIKIAEGVSMEVEVTYREEYDGKAWVPIAESRRVTKLLKPLPPPPVTPLFGSPDLP